MRRKDREITELSKMIDIMSKCDCCRLGFVDENEAYIVPMNFGYEIDHEQIILYFHCASAGRKLELLPKQTSVSFEMDTKHQLTTGTLGCDFSFLYQCIMGVGKLEIISNKDEKIDGLKKIMNHYTNSKEWEFNEEIVNRTTILKLIVQKWSCKEH